MAVGIRCADHAIINVSQNPNNFRCILCKTMNNLGVIRIFAGLSSFHDI
jgi:hypothetical protein